MIHRFGVATVVAAACLFTSGAYAGSPYYDAPDGQAVSAPTLKAHTRVPTAPRQRSFVSSRAAAQYKTSAKTAEPTATSDGYAKPAADAEFFDHATGTDGSTVATGEAAPDKPAPVYSAAMPKMDADGFQHRESASSLFQHAVGTDGSAAEDVAAPAAPAAQPVYTAALPKMDPDGYQHREAGSSYYGHAVGSDGSP